MAHVILQAVSFDPRVTGVAQRSARVLDETSVSQLDTAFFTAEASWMPIGIHGLYYSANNKFT